MTPSFKVGDLEIKGYSDGLLKTSLDLVVDMERARSEALVGGTDNGWLFIPVNNFVFQRDGKTILIDAGAGNTMQPTLGKLPENLRAGGIDPGVGRHHRPHPYPSRPRQRPRRRQRRGGLSECRNSRARRGI